MLCCPGVKSARQLGSSLLRSSELPFRKPAAHPASCPLPHPFLEPNRELRGTSGSSAPISPSKHTPLADGDFSGFAVEGIKSRVSSVVAMSFVLSAPDVGSALPPCV